MAAACSSTRVQKGVCLGGIARRGVQAATLLGLGQAFKTFDRDSQGRFPFFHAVTNHWVKLTGPDTAEGRCYLIDFETASKPDPNLVLLLGLYADA